MKTKSKMENSPAQRDSKMSNGRLSGLFCRWQGGWGHETSPAQRHSGISILGIGLIGPMRPIGLMGQKPAMKNSPAQRHFPAKAGSILKTGPYRPYRPLSFKNHPAQRDSKMSNGRLSGVLCWPHGHKTKNHPAQRGSKNSNFGFPLCLVCCNCTVFTIPSATWEPTGSSRGSGEKE